MTFNEINNQAASPNAHNLIQEGAVLLKDGDDAEFMMEEARHKKYWFLDVQNQMLGEKGLEY